MRSFHKIGRDYPTRTKVIGNWVFEILDLIGWIELVIAL